IEIIHADVRIICATNAPIGESVQRGNYRNDLYYRINTIEILLPTLLESKDAYPLLFDHYLKDYCKRYQKTLAPDSTLVQQLTRYRWAGNIRELQDAIERAVILCSRPEMTLHDFQLYGSPSDTDSEVRSLNLTAVE